MIAFCLPFLTLAWNAGGIDADSGLAAVAAWRRWLRLAIVLAWPGGAAVAALPRQQCNRARVAAAAAWLWRQQWQLSGRTAAAAAAWRPHSGSGSLAAAVAAAAAAAMRQ